MLDTGGNALALDAANVGHGEAAGKERVLAHIFERAATEGSADHVDGGAEEHVLLEESSLLAHGLTDAVDQ